MEDILNKCRICLKVKSPRKLLQLFDRKSQTIERILAVTGIEVDGEFKDYLPDKICFQCSDALLHAFQFRTLALASDALLKDQLAASNLLTVVKEEFGIDDTEILDEFKDVVLSTAIENFCEIAEDSDDDDFFKGAPAATNEQPKQLPTQPKPGKRDQQRYKICEVCGKSFTKNYIANHRLTHQTAKLKKYHCDLCGLSFTMKCYIYSHVRNVHSSAKRWVCNVCGKSYAKKNPWECHMRIHSENGRIYKCNFENCTKSFRKQNHLTVHKRIHSNERPYSCVFCDRSFIHYTDHKRHVMKHTGERPHRCKFANCSRGFIKKSELTAHAKTHQRT